MEPQFQQTLQSLQDYLMILLIVGVVLFALAIAIRWLIFAKAGEPGWAAIVPIYNIVVFLRIVGRPWWHIFLFLIPIYGLILAFILLYQLAKVFGYGFGFFLGLLFLPIIFFPILAFGPAKYVGPDGAGSPRRRPRDDDYEEEEDDRPRQKIPARRPIPDDSFEEEERPAPKKPSPITPALSQKVKPAPASGSDDKVVVQCSNCHKRLKVAAHAVGKKVKCPGCGTAFVA